MVDDRILHDRLSASYDDKYLESIASKMFLEYEMGFIERHLPECGRILELGCGTGISSTFLSRHCKFFYGVDYSSGMIKATKNKAGSYACADASSLPFKDGFFDTVVCRGALHHMKNVRQVLLEVRRVLSAGGVFVLLEPSKTNLVIQFLRSLMKRFFSSYSADQTQFSATQLENLLEGSGFAVGGVEFVGYFSNFFEFTDKMPLSKFVPAGAFKLVLGLDDWLSRRRFFRGLIWGVLVFGVKSP